jgi:hypothetical protein
MSAVSSITINIGQATSGVAVYCTGINVITGNLANGGQPNYIGATDANGNVVFSNLAQGSYIVRPVLSGGAYVWGQKTYTVDGTSATNVTDTMAGQAITAARGFSY